MKTTNNGQNSEENQREDRDPRRMWPALINLINSNASYWRAQTKKANDPQPEKIRFWTMVAAIGTCFGVILAGVAAYVFWLQLDAMRRANAGGDKAFESTERAWIAPQNANLLNALVVGEPFDFDIRYNNVGKDPALDVRPTYRVDSVSKDRFTDNSLNSIIESHNVCKNVEIAPGADVVYPEQPDGNHLQFGVKKGWMNADIVSGKSALLVEMCFAYKTLGAVHHTAFCYFYLPGVSKNRQFNTCTAGNHAD